jgi:hypothetical protein
LRQHDGVTVLHAPAQAHLGETYAQQ